MAQSSRKLVLTVLKPAFAVPAPDVALFAINDSVQDGATAVSSHPFAKLLWNSTRIEYPQRIRQGNYSALGTGYGDCVDRNGAAYPAGQAHFGQLTLPALGKSQTVAIDATALVNFWIAGFPNWGMTLIGAPGSISNFASRADAIIANRPELDIVRADGVRVSVPCSANRSLIAPSTGSTSAVIDCTSGGGSLILCFDLAALDAPVQNAALRLVGMTRGVPNTISLYATDLSYVLRAQLPRPGLAANSVKDAALVAGYQADLALAAGANPPTRPTHGVIYAETWPDLTGMPARNYYQRSSSGSPVPSTASLIGASDRENPGYAPLAPGINAMKVKMNPGMAVAMNLIWPFNGVWGYAPEHIWLRFYLMLANDWPFFDTTPNAGFISPGKFPFAPACHTPPGKPPSPIGRKTRVAPLVSWSPSGVIPDGGNGGVPATGANMWSMRNYFYVMGPASKGVVDPAVFGPLGAAGYWPISSEDAYTADQYGPYGDDNFWMSERTLAALMKRNTWHAIEIHIRMNSLWTAASAGPDPVYLGDARRMPYRRATDAPISDQMGRDTKVVAFDRFIYFGNVTGERYPGAVAPIAPDTRVLRSDQAYSQPSMIGVKDGIYEVYVDGVLAHRRTDMRWRHIPDVKIDCLWFDYGQTQLVAGGTGSAYFAQAIAVDGDVVSGPIGPMRMN